MWGVQGSVCEYGSYFLTEKCLYFNISFPAGQSFISCKNPYQETYSAKFLTSCLTLMPGLDAFIRFYTAHSMMRE